MQSNFLIDLDSSIFNSSNLKTKPINCFVFVVLFSFKLLLHQLNPFRYFILLSRANLSILINADLKMIFFYLK